MNHWPGAQALVRLGVQLTPAERQAILDKNAVIPAGTRIGYDLEKDRERYHVSETGIVVVEGRRSPIPLSPVTI